MWFYSLHHMSNEENNSWPGPFESQKDFETFQDQSIAAVADFALNSRPHISDSTELKNQLWSLGKVLPAAILGLGRYNPEKTEVGISKTERVTLSGRPAYEHMASTWHNLGNRAHTPRFRVNATFESPYQLEATYTGNTCLFIGGEAKTEQGPFLWECLSLPDTSRLTDEDKDSHVMNASVTNTLMGHGAPVAFTASPFRESESASRSGYGELTAENVRQVAGRTACEALQRYGKVGLYHHLLRSTVRKLLAGVNLGPVELR